MTAIATASVMTTEELLGLPENGMDRWLIRGQLREKPMTRRNRFHAGVEARITQLLLNWVDQQPEPRGKVFSGEAGCRLRRNPDTTVGIDVVYISSDLVGKQPRDTTLIEGVPTLVVEILSPSDREEEVNEKVDVYLQAGVALVWLVDPHYQTIQVHRPEMDPELFNVRRELSADPHLPGFRVSVARIFGP